MSFIHRLLHFVYKTEQVHQHLQEHRAHQHHVSILLTHDQQTLLTDFLKLDLYWLKIVDDTNDKGLKMELLDYRLNILYIIYIIIYIAKNNLPPYFLSFLFSILFLKSNNKILLALDGSDL